MSKRLLLKWGLALSVLPIVVVVVLAKALFIYFGLEFLSLNLLFSGVIAANVFLLGFLITGVLVDYKESERLPGDLAAGLGSIFDEVYLIYRAQKPLLAKDCLNQILDVSVALKNWFYRKEHTEELMAKLTALYEFLGQLGPWSDSSSIARIKGEHSGLRRILVRVRTIRGTYFIPSGYAIAEATNILVIFGLLITKTPSIYEALFFSALITFLNMYMLALIRRLDNPFDYYTSDTGVEVSLLPLDEVEQRIRGFMQTM